MSSGVMERRAAAPAAARPWGKRLGYPALALALLVQKTVRGVGIFRSVFFLPVVFPIALVALIWRLILARGDDGLLNSLLGFFSAGAFGAQDWLGSELTALASVIVLSIWQGVGFQMVILLAALQQVPADLYEAARLDRAGAWQRFVHVTLPGINTTLVFVALYTMILSLRVFDQIYVLARSGGGRLVAVACVGGDGQPLMPCGRCRQLLWEFGGAEMMIESVSLGSVPMREVLPDAFGPDDLVAAAAR